MSASVAILGETDGEAGTAGPRAERRARLSMAWLGVVPFLAFALLFLVGPTLYLVVGAFQNPAGEFTFANMTALFQPQILAAYWISIRVSLASAGLGALIGFFVAYAIVHGGLPACISLSPRYWHTSIRFASSRPARASGRRR